MFCSADVLIDEYSRPIFVIEQNLAPGDMVMELGLNSKITFKLDSQIVGELENVDEDILDLSTLQKTIGIIAYEQDTDIPEHYTHTATVIDLIREK